MKRVSIKEKNVSIERLLRLIRVMSQSQKRDFKKHSKFWGKGGTKYILLFDLLNKHISSRKEDAMLDKNKSLRKIGASYREINLVSAYLYKKILESMKLTPEKENYYNRINSLFQEISFLYHKSLFEDCLDLIIEAKSLSYKLDKSVYVLESLFWERRIEETLNIKNVTSNLKNINKEESIVLKNLSSFMHFNALLSRLTISFRKEIDLDDDIAQIMTSLISTYEEKKHEITSPRIKIKILHSIVIYCYMSHNSLINRSEKSLEKAMIFLLDIIKIYNQDKNFILKEEEITMYYHVVNSYINIAIKLGKSNDLNAFKKSLNNIKGNFSIERSIDYANIIEFIKNNKFNDAQKYIEDTNLEILLTQNKGQTTEQLQLALRYCCGQVYFILEDFHKSHYWFDKVVSETRMDNRPELGDLARMLNHISQFEINKQIDITKKYIAIDYLRKKVQKEKIFDEEKQILNEFKIFLLDIVIIVMNGEMMHINEAHLNKIKKNVLDIPHFNMYGIVLSWVESKLDNLTIINVVKKYIR